MKITKLILHKYKRLFLNNITTLVYTPESAIQLILGSNGSGKSSLLSVLNPLPIDIKKRFNDGGYAEIHIDKDNYKFKLTSGIGGKAGKYSFIVNDIEKNEGGTRKAQLQLVEEYFRLTPKMNEIVLGTKTLTSMTSIERKEWFRHMSTVDYSYSISMFNKLRTRLRDVAGGIKILNNELTKDTELLLDEKTMSDYKTHSKYIKKTIEDLMFKYNHNTINVTDVLDTINSLTNRLDTLYQDIHSLYTVDDIEKDILKLNYKVEILSKDIDDTNKELDKIEYIEKNDVDEGSLLQHLSLVNKEISNLDNVLIDIEVDKTQLAIISDSYNNIYTNLVGVSTDISEYDDIVITKDTHQSLTTIVNDLSTELNIKRSRFKSYQDELKRLKDSLSDDNKIVCSNCAHVSYFGYDKKRVVTIEEQLKELEVKIETLNSSYKIKHKELSRVNGKVDVLKRLQQIIKDNSNLHSIWSYIFNNEPIGSITSYNLLMKFEKVKSLLDISSTYPKLLQNKTELENKLTIAKEVKKVKQDLVIGSKKDYLNKLDILTASKKETISEIQKLVKLKKEVITVKEIESKLKDLLTVTKNNKKNEIEKVKNQGIKDLVSVLKEELLDIEEKVSNNDRVVSKIETNKKLLEEYKLKQKVLSRVVKALSPTEGLIAKSINSFINKILQEINTIINEIWSYEMILLPCDITEDNDLDYLFKVQVDNREIIEDVSNLSSSMKEIVNLAFRIVFMKYSKLDYMPLILDEFGVTMDSKHRHSAYNVIDNILCSNFNQIFITAHFQSIYTRFVNADLNVLDDKNIELSSSTIVNEKIKIT